MGIPQSIIAGFGLICSLGLLVALFVGTDQGVQVALTLSEAFISIIGGIAEGVFGGLFGGGGDENAAGIAVSSLALAA